MKTQELISINRRVTYQRLVKSTLAAQVRVQTASDPILPLSVLALATRLLCLLNLLQCHIHTHIQDVEGQMASLNTTSEFEWKMGLQMKKRVRLYWKLNGFTGT